MRERGAFGFLGGILILTILFFIFEVGESEMPVNEVQNNNGPTVRINGRSFEPTFIDRGDSGRLVIVVDQDDLYVGENTVEIQWGQSSSTTMTAELPSATQQH